MDTGKRKGGLYFTSHPKILEVKILKKSHSHLKIESGGKDSFAGRTLDALGGLMIRGFIKHVLHERRYFLPRIKNLSRRKAQFSFDPKLLFS